MTGNTITWQKTMGVSARHSHFGVPMLNITLDFSDRVVYDLLKTKYYTGTEYQEYIKISEKQDKCKKKI